MRGKENLLTRAAGLFSIENGVSRICIIGMRAAFPVQQREAAPPLLVSLVAADAAAGVSIVAFLSGFGAVNAIASNLSLFLRNVREADIEDLDRQYLKTADSILTKKKRIFLLRLQKARGGAIDAGTGGLLASTLSLLRGGGGGTAAAAAQQEAQLEREVAALEDFARELFLEATELRHERTSFFSRAGAGACDAQAADRRQARGSRMRGRCKGE